VTALSLTACVLLIALWVRSYWRLDTVEVYRGYTILSMRGRLFTDGRFVQIVALDITRDLTFFPGTSTPISGGIATLTHPRVGLPIWLFILLAAMPAATVWLRPRFSLRTLLIATTLVAVMLGLMVAT
jgi:hypothetical protein